MIRNGACSESTSENQPDLKFHAVHGKKMTITKARRYAVQTPKDGDGIVFSDRPISMAERVCLRLSQTAERSPNILRFGVTNINPWSMAKDGQLQLTDPIAIDQRGYWTETLPDRCASGDCLLQFFVSHNGDLDYSLNESFPTRLITDIDVSRPLWAILNVTGSMKAIELVSPSECKTNEGDTDIERELWKRLQSTQFDLAAQQQAKRKAESAFDDVYGELHRWKSYTSEERVAYWRLKDEESLRSMESEVAMHLEAKTKAEKERIEMYDELFRWKRDFYELQATRADETKLRSTEPDVVELQEGRVQADVELKEARVKAEKERDELSDELERCKMELAVEKTSKKLQRSIEIELAAEREARGKAEAAFDKVYEELNRLKNSSRESQADEGSMKNEERLRSMESEMAMLVEAKTEAEIDRIKLSDKFEQCKKELEKERQWLRWMERELIEEQEARGKAEAALEKARKELDRMRNDCSEKAAVDGSMKEKEKESLRSMESELAMHLEAKTKTENERIELSDELERCKAELAEKMQWKKRLEWQFSTLNKQLNDREREAELAQKKMRKGEKEIAQLRSDFAHEQSLYQAKMEAQRLEMERLRSIDYDATQLAKRKAENERNEVPAEFDCGEEGEETAAEHPWTDSDVTSVQNASSKADNESDEEHHARMRKANAELAAALAVHTTSMTSSLIDLRCDFLANWFGATTF